MLMTSKTLLPSSPSARSHRGLPDDQRDLGLCWADVASVEVPSILRNDRRRKRKGRSEGADTTIVTPHKPLSRRGFSRPHPKDGNSLTPIGVHPNPSDAELTVFWRRQLSGQDTVDGLPRPVTMLSGAEAKHDRRHERIAEYFQYLARNRTSPLREKSPDCTVLSINPEKVNDWRNGHYRCCYQPAILKKPGRNGGQKFDVFDRTELYERDCWGHRPSSWHVAKLTLGTTATRKCFFESFWDNRKTMDQKATIGTSCA